MYTISSLAEGKLGKIVLLLVAYSDRPEFNMNGTVQLWGLSHLLRGWSVRLFWICVVDVVHFSSVNFRVCSTVKT